MNRRMRSICLMLATAMLGLGFVATAAHAADWVRWLGPNQDGTAAGDGLFPEDGFGLDVAWARPLGIGYSGIAVAEERAITLFADGESDFLVAVDAGTGEELWRYRIDAMYGAHDGSEGGPVGMPVVDDGVVYGVGAQGHLFAVRLEDGEAVWSLHMEEAFGSRAPGYGYTTCPLAVGDLLFVQTGGTGGRSLAGLEKTTGKVVWSIGDDEVTYQSPILATLAGREQIVAVTEARILGLVPASGEILWSHALEMEDGQDAYATPLLLGDDRFLLTGQEESRAYRVAAADGVFALEEVWTSTNLKQSLATPVLHEGYLYGFSGDFLTCVNSEDGEKVWKSRPPGGRGLILVDDRLVIFANDGSVVVVRASSEGYREEARVKVSEAGTYTYPSFADGVFFVRNTRDFAAVKVGPALAEAAIADLAAPRHGFERFVRAVEKADDPRLLVDEFMTSQSGFPVVENDRWVHFLYRGAVEDIALTGSMLEYQTEEPLVRVAETDLYYRSFEIEPGARWEYRFNVDFDNPQPDPLNPWRVAGDPNGDFSEVATSGWKRPGYLAPYRGDRPGRVETFTLASEIMGDEREIAVYLPAGHGGGNDTYPLLVVNDGKDWLADAHMANTLNHLVGRSVAPVVVAFVERPQATAQEEFGGDKSADYVRMLTEELVPRLEADYRTRAEPEARAIMGIADGALMAVHAAVARPDVFGKAGGCSFYLANPETPHLKAALAERTGQGQASFWIVWNRYEWQRPEWNVDLARDSKAMVETLRSHGYSVDDREALDSAGWGSWRIETAEILQQIFPD